MPQIAVKSLASMCEIKVAEHNLASPRRLEEAKHNLVPRVFVALDQRSENESSGSNHFEITKEITEFHAVCIYGACLKWLLPELSIPATRQKNRGLWGREWAEHSFQVPLPNTPLLLNY